VIQVIERHVGENVSEEVSIDFAVVPGASSFLSISIYTIRVGGSTQSIVIIGWIKWELKASENVLVLHSDVTSGSGVFVINPDAIFRVVPPFTVSVDSVHGWTSSWFIVAKMAPATVFENVGKSEKIHNVSVISR